MNTFGNVFRFTTFGESHGPAIGGVIDGFPAGVAIDMDFIQNELDRRRPGQSYITTPRRESDTVEILSGVFEGMSTGCSIGFVIRNQNQHSKDYDNLRDLFRPSHADYTYYAKYGHRDHTGGGRSSARETAVRVVAGAFAKLALRDMGVVIHAYTEQVGHISVGRPYTELDLTTTEQNPVRCPDQAIAAEMKALIEAVRKEGDTIGGVIACVIKGAPVGLGEPIYGKLHAALGGAMLSINAVKGFEYGQGFGGVHQRGSEQNDAFCPDGQGGITTETNRSGGIQGGISNGQDIYFRTAFKPVATILQPQHTVNKAGERVEFLAKGRHDACVLPRAVPIVEAMAASVMLDFALLQRMRQ